MRKVFLDIGAHTGQSVDQFYEEIEDASDWVIVTFEPLFSSELKKNVSKYSNVLCVNAVVSTINGKTQMFHGPRGSQSSTLMLGKLSGPVFYDNSTLENCIDLITWFNDFMEDDAFVIVKMNIEGGEYPLMPRLPEILPKIAGIHIKLHHTKFESEKRQEFVSIYQDFKSKIDQFKKTFIFCDVTESPYRFKWLVEKAYAKRNQK